MTNSTSSAMFVTAATIMAYSGERPSPSARRMPANKLYAITTGNPANSAVR